MAPLIALLVRPRAVVDFFKNASLIDREDLRWWARFPGFVITPSRYPPQPHRGHFDPGQRLMAWGLVLLLVVLTLTGLMMVFAVDYLGGGYGIVLRAHAVSAVALAVLVAGHVGIGVGIPKGYRGVWRVMHFPGGGLVSRSLAEALWPEWARRASSSRPPVD